MLPDGQENRAELIPTRLNMEPPVFRGCSLSELLTIAAICAVVLIPTCIAVLAIVGYPMMGIGIGSLATIGGVVVGATQLQRMKRGRPVGYYQLQIALVMENIRMRKTGLITKSSYWAIGRTQK